MEIVLTLKDNFYKEIEKVKGNQVFIKRKLIKKNVVTNLNIDSNDIMGISDHLDNKGNIKKNYCRVHIKELGQVLVNHSREYVSKLKQHKFTPIGFKYGRK